MSNFNENIVTGKKYRVCTDAATNTWDRVSMWTSANDVEMTDGTTVEDAVSTLNESLTVNSDTFYFDMQDGKYGFNTSPERGADTFHPFKSGSELVGLQHINLSSVNIPIIKTENTQINDYKVPADNVNRTIELPAMANNEYFYLIRESYNDNDCATPFTITNVSTNNGNIIELDSYGISNTPYSAITLFRLSDADNAILTIPRSWYTQNVKIVEFTM